MYLCNLHIFPETAHLRDRISVLRCFHSRLTSVLAPCANARATELVEIIPVSSRPKFNRSRRIADSAAEEAANEKTDKRGSARASERAICALDARTGNAVTSLDITILVKRHFGDAAYGSTSNGYRSGRGTPTGLPLRTSYRPRLRRPKDRIAQRVSGRTSSDIVGENVVARDYSARTETSRFAPRIDRDRRKIVQSASPDEYDR